MYSQSKIILMSIMISSSLSLDPPYIRLVNVLDEPYGNGWGMDLPGYGDTMQFTDVQTHTLKPGNASTSGDMNQVFVGDMIVFVNDGEGHCMQVSVSWLNEILYGFPSM